MALNTQLDSLKSRGAALPYNKILEELDTTPRIVSGTNMLSTVGGKLIKRPGCTAIASTTLGYRIDRLVVYETLDSPQRIYLLASAFTGTYWEMFYIRLGVTAWTSLGSTRSLNLSTRPHEITTARGLAYIKGFPGGSEKYGSCIFNGASGAVYTTFWGLAPPTVAARLNGSVETLLNTITASQTTMVGTYGNLPTGKYVDIGEETIFIVSVASVYNYTISRAQQGTTASTHSAGAQAIYKDGYWGASGYQVTVDLGWRYSYAYKSRLGHKSCRAPFETNPDKVPSDTGAFSNQCPEIAISGLPADTVNVPQISIYRTTDGGGALFFLQDVTNTGSSLTYADNQLAGLASTVNPQPDELLDSSNVAPSRISNLPPPPVAPPKVAGTDAIEASSPLAYYAGRIWYWVNNHLFYSGDEEITEGIPEESFPGGTFGNFYRAKHPGLNVHATTEALYAWTGKDTYVVRGQNRKTFSFDKLISGVGMANHPRAVTSIGDKVIWLTQDYRLVAARGDNLVVLSDDLGNDLLTWASASNADVEVHYFAEREKEYIVVNVVNKTSLTSRQFVYDIKLSEKADIHWWNTPWTIQNSAAVSDRVYESDPRRYLVFFAWNGTTGQLIQWDSSEATVQDAGTSYSWDATFNLTESPTGNHVNALRNPHLASAIYGFALERTKFAGDADPTLQWYKDDLWTTPATLTAVAPARRAASIGYSTLEYKLNDAVQRVAIKLSKAADTQRFELQTLTYTFNPDGGA